MIVVLVAARYKRILQWLKQSPIENIESIEIVKQVGPKLFLYVETSLSYQQLIRSFKKRICESGGAMYVYQFYGIFNGMIDYNEYLPASTKLSMPYYQSEKKDILESQYMKK